ncbi:hypothetical protein HDU92_001011 [Lobulomyces angularis]|nr:hypothetical protein HDU92_001011 [Lobulomyces angularis]
MGNERKFQSYIVEKVFYDFKFEIPNCKFPSVVYLEKFKTDEENLYLTDLKPEFCFTYGHRNEISSEMEDIYLVLKWLASFHAFFWESKVPNLHQQGGYWYLDTRWVELERMKNCELKSKAKLIDRLLKGELHNGKFRTIIHGDAKSENILFSSTECALYDFQYTGEGFGEKDIVYFFISSLDETILQKYEMDYLKYYYNELIKNLKSNNKSTDFSFENCMMQYKICLLDYYRFVLGWGCWGNSNFAEVRSEQILTELGNYFANLS